MSRIDELIEADSANVPVSRDLLRTFDPATMEVFEIADELFETFNRCAAETFSALDAADDRELQAIAAHMGVSRDQLIGETRSNNARPDVERARTLWKAIGFGTQRGFYSSSYRVTFAGPLPTCSGFG